MWRTLTLQRKLLAGFAAVVVLVVALGLYLVSQLGSLATNTSALFDENYVPVREGQSVRALLVEQAYDVSRHVLGTTDQEMAEQEDAIAVAHERLEASMEQVRRVAAPDEEEWLDAFASSYADVRDQWTEVVALSRSGDKDQAGVRLVEAAAPYEAALAAMTSDIDYNDRLAQERRDAAAAAFGRTRTLAFAALAVIAGLAVGVGVLLSRDVARRVGASALALARSSAELGVASGRLGVGAEETASQAQVVAAAGEQVSSNVATVATAVEEMNASVREIAANAQEASRVAGSAVEIADQTNATVAKLGESSAEIGKVIEVITSIAEQTNLLALNATIEAARAGRRARGSRWWPVR